MIRTFAPAASPLHGWVRACAQGAPAGDIELVVSDVSQLAEARHGLTGDARVIVCLPLGPAEDLMALRAHDFVAARADAYATSEADLREALAFVAREEREARAQGPLRLTWLGPLGQLAPVGVGPIGRGHALADAMLVGRDAASTLVLRTGGHSDQNTVARRHAELTREGASVCVRDLGSTNGTWIDGRKVRDERLALGSELAFAGTLRFRLDGTH